MIIGTVIVQRRLLLGLSLCGVLSHFPAGALCAQSPEKASSVAAGDEAALAQFHKTVQPIIQKYCYDCHGDGSTKGGLALDELTTPDQLLRNPQLWLKVLRNTRSNIMPPPDADRPAAAEQAALEQWITRGAFGLDPAQPDPGRVTVRHLNRTEYRNTLRDLLGIDFDAEAMLPPDDVGYGFDNIGDVLSFSPMRIEKFIEAAIAAVDKGFPTKTYAMTSQATLAKDWLTEGTAANGDRMSFYEVRKVSRRFQAQVAGEYRIVTQVKIDGNERPDPQRVTVTGTVDGSDFFQKEYHWSDAEYFTETSVVRWEPGEHTISYGTQPVDPTLKPLPMRLDFRLLTVTVEGPLDEKKWLHPEGYSRFFPREAPPADQRERRAYASEVISRFARKAYRRPVDKATIERLVDLAEQTYSLPDRTFEKGIAQAVVAILASPPFLFHLEASEPVASGKKYASVDEHTLAARLSYALWASMPDDELMGLADRGELRKNFRAQVKRMLGDPKARALGENFAGQWLQSRGVMDTPINSAVVMALEPPVAMPAPAAGAPTAGGRGGGRGGRGRPTTPPGTVLTPEIRTAMRQEAESYFNHVVQADRSILEFIDSNYTFVNEPLAAVYGIPDVTGSEMRRVALPPDSLRGGVLTMGSVLTVTSNPTRTSPVKRGRWIIENILGSPSAPPPPDIPALDDTESKFASGKVPTQRELLALHRADPICASCHVRMDPLGLALESFNAFGRQRTMERNQPIDPAGELATGETFSGIADLKRALVANHRREFYRTFVEKLMTYVLGRGPEYYDVITEDAIIARLEREDDRFSTVLMSILESAPFQQRRPQPNPLPQKTASLNP